MAGMRMGVPPLGMPMGMPMAFPMGMPMGLPMGMGMPMMGMMGMPAMPMMAPMMPMGVNPLLAAPLLQAQAGVPAAPSSEKREAAGKKEQLMKDLEAAGSELAPHRRETRETHASSPGRASSPSGHEPREVAVTPEPDRSDPVREAEGEQGEPPRCHLHPQKKPNPKCKFCQRAQGQSVATKAEQQETKASAGGSAASSSGAAAAAKAAPQPPAESEDYSRRTFNCSPMLKDQIFSSSYFKSLLSITSIEDLTDEIANYADTLDVYNSGSTVSPSCFICQVYRLFTLPHAEDLGELQVVLDHPRSAIVRCAGFLYMRFVVGPAHLWDKLEEYLFDDMELRYTDAGKQVTSTIGEYVEALLVKDKYFSTPLPRIPVKVRQMLEKELAPLQIYRKRMQANQRTFKAKRVQGLAVEVCLDGNWVPGTVREFMGKTNPRRKVRVHLDDGQEVSVHLGKVVLRDPPDHGESDESGSEGGKRRQRRSRSRSRGASRRNSPDWSRWKGRSDADLVEALREKAKEEAVCGHGKAYARRPLTVEEELWKRDPEARVSMLGDENRPAYRRAPPERDPRAADAQKRRPEEEEEQKRRMRDIYEKYGSASKTVSQATVKRMDVEEPEVLRLG